MIRIVWAWPKVYWERVEHTKVGRLGVWYGLPGCLWKLLTGYYDE